MKDEHNAIDAEITADVRAETEAVLSAWRTKALNLMLTVGAVVAFPAVTATLILTFRRDQPPLRALGFAAIYLLLLALAVWRRLDPRVRGWGAILIGYAAGVFAFVQMGLAGSGRMYVIVLPVLAMILIGVRSGFIAAALSLAISGVFAVLARLGVLEGWLVYRYNPLSLGYWTESGVTLAMLLALAVGLLYRFYRLQVKTLVAERQTAAQLAAANVRLEEYNRTLERKVAQRTTELEEAVQRAREARATAEAANRAKSAFLATVSHELRTPLTSVLGFTKIIQKRLDGVVFPVVDSDDRKVRRAVEQVGTNLDIIVSEGQRLTTLINDVLDLAKIESGRVEWHMAPVAVREIIEHALNATASLFQGQPLELVVDVAPDLPRVVADRDRLVQVMVNLLSNAVKFTDRGSVTCRARMREDCQDDPSASQAWLEISVIDTGIGIDPQDYDKVFEQFVQVGDTLTDRPHGTGLGLAICKRIVEHHGGQIGVDSVPGSGSTFTFTLPVPASQLRPGVCQDGTATGEPRPTVMGEIRRRVAETLQRRNGEAAHRILVVDDEAHIRTLLRQELHEAGYQVIEAADGAEALRQARENDPDLIILDVMMPHISGFDVTSVLKADPLTADIPILILSIIEDRRHGLALGADAYLTKPIDLEQLLDTISGLLARQALDEAAPPQAIVVGHDPAVVASIAAALREQGFQVSEAHDAQGAITAAQAVKPDLIVLDEAISTLNDAEILKALRFQAPDLEYTIIVISGQTGNADSGGTG